MAHTPGPWSIGAPTGKGSGTRWVDVVSNGTEFSPSFVCSALDVDARLIAAAPEMLAGCVAILERLESPYTSPMQDDELADLCRQLIAKATGEGVQP